MFQNLGKQAKVFKVSDAVAAGTSNVTGNTFDMQGFENCLVIWSLGALTAGQQTKSKIQAGAASNGSDAADVANSGNPQSAVMPDGDSNKFLVTDVVRSAISPLRYITPVLLRGTQNAVVNWAVAILYNPSRLPVQSGQQDANLSGSVLEVIEQKLGTAN